MGTTKNKSYGKQIKKPKLKNLREKFKNMENKLNDEYSYERRKMKFPKEEMIKYPNIFEVEK